MVAQQEVIMVCVDNTSRAEHFASQLDAIHVYCHAKLKSNPKTAVGIYTLARGIPNSVGFLRPSSDLEEIMVHAQNIPRNSNLVFRGLIMHSTMYLKSDQPNVQKRVLIFARGPTDMCFPSANRCGNILKKEGIAVDLVNFCLEKEKRSALDTFVAAVNNNGNSHIKHFEAGYSIRDLLSSTPAIITPEEIAAAAELKMPPRFPRKIKFRETMDAELFFKELRKRQKSQAAADDEHADDENVNVNVGVNKFQVLFV